MAGSFGITATGRSRPGLREPAIPPAAKTVTGGRRGRGQTAPTLGELDTKIAEAEALAQISDTFSPACSTSSVDDVRRSTWWNYPTHCQHGHPWAPGCSRVVDAVPVRARPQSAAEGERPPEDRLPHPGLYVGLLPAPARARLIRSSDTLRSLPGAARLIAQRISRIRAHRQKHATYRIGAFIELPSRSCRSCLGSGDR